MVSISNDAKTLCQWLGSLSRFAPPEEMGADLVPDLEPRLSRDEDPQRSSYGTDPRVRVRIIITSMDYGAESPRLRCMLSDRGR